MQMICRDLVCTKFWVTGHRLLGLKCFTLYRPSSEIPRGGTGETLIIEEQWVPGGRFFGRGADG